MNAAYANSEGSNAACAANRTIQDVRRVRMYMATATEEQNTLMLPVFYLNLDPAGIPDPFDSDASPPEAPGLIARALLSLEALDVCGSSRDKNLILLTPGVFFMVAKAWPHVLKLVDAKKREVGFSDLCGFLADERVAEPANLVDLIDGAGGTVEDLARLVVLYIDSLLPAPNTAMHFMNVHFLSGVLDFIMTVDPAVADPDTMERPLSDFAISLLSGHIVRALSNAGCALSVTANPNAVHALNRNFIILGILLGTNPGYQRIPEALDHKILRALVTYAQNPANDPQSYTMVFLVAISPPNLVYHSVMSTLAPALVDVADIVGTHSFKTSQIYEQWEQFVALAKERREVFDYYNSGKNPSMRACGNMKVQNPNSSAVSDATAFITAPRHAKPWIGAKAAIVRNEIPTESSFSVRQRSPTHGAKLIFPARCGPSRLPEIETQYIRSANNVHEDAPWPELPYALRLYSGTRKAQHPAARQCAHKGASEWGGKGEHRLARGSKWRAHEPGCHRDAWRGGNRYWAIPLRTNTRTVYEGLQQLARELPAHHGAWDKEFIAERLIPFVVNEDPNALEIH
ncbi:hypothetical protein DFH09DRAFT_1088707 [Mycena vulgaris]|nr:hypothetical protein DFH09DRAFT_1088707 [Mycena vulgaris]